MKQDAGTKRSRWAALSLISIGIVAGLSGCSPEAQVFARIDGGELTFLVCEQFNATRIAVSTADQSSQTYTDAWTAEGSATLDKGSKIVFGSAPDGMTSGPEKAVEPSSTKVEIAIDGTREDGTAAVLVAVFSAGRITDEGWSGQTSSVVGNPCQSE
jgi:hypothetical protein